MTQFLLLLLTAFPVQAQPPVVLREMHQVGTQHKVSCRVELSGTLTLPLEKGQSVAKTLKVTGSSTLDYHERILALNKDLQVDRTIRQYRKLDFQRKVGEQAQQSSLRAAVNRLVILRQNQVEVPFSPDGPMTWNELDMIRTDVFAPALAGLLPAQAVSIGDTWKASTVAIQELTDLEKIDEASVTCKLDQLTVVGGRKHATSRRQGGQHARYCSRHVHHEPLPRVVQGTCRPGAARVETGAQRGEYATALRQSRGRREVFAPAPLARGGGPRAADRRRRK
jgi:hypothetical protein